ncbi:hypothetical protein [Streptantibioticus cattleyicolor]|uniref:Gram-positive cocci surface proteins LPxTG domain-containing protein n=1 Tax=Streptantibioticus cattleyicolor (strain ATCC 35852 / DSM 46488 / JCM 4925 / NBRC 14057 / NRRL 8057) TaxID=1003195 RepID=F8JKI6_STREN|nr:hypothetical protein [Streptantibioticus cattleyicolor]AEW99744.1 hypothetical protein SCATT_p15510 [Streptantibioticus cattleyicolor NRRL 8057 = DSM 46488]CCB71215.1 exported protein of unknown function [Streptantibioticus cattleyicolor NRRL 8057 = DSM 46488]
MSITSGVRAGRRGAVRATLIGVAVAAAVLGPVSGAFAAGTTTPDTTAGAAASPSAAPGASSTPSSTPSAAASAKPAPHASAATPASGTHSAPAGPSSGASVFTLVDGERAFVSKMKGKGFYRAEIPGKKGQPLAGILETHGRDDAIDLHGMHVVLNAATGWIASWWLSSTAPEPRDCTATTTIASVFPPYKVLLSNGPAGPRATLRTSDGHILAVVDRAHPENLDTGMRIRDIGGAPEFFQRSQGGSMPWGPGHAFPALPKCPAGTTPAGTAAAGGATTATQTTVVPVGAVAAGVENGSGHDDTAALTGAAVAAAGAAGLGVAVARRRRAARADG